MFIAEIFARQYFDSWKAACPRMPLVQHKSDEPFKQTIQEVLTAHPLEETRIFHFVDGSILTMSTDRNGQHSVIAEQQLKF